MLREALERLIKLFGRADSPAHVNKNVSDFMIEEQEDRYVISPVKYKNELYEVSWSRELLDSGNYNTQDEWIEILKDSEWWLPSGPLYHATIDALSQNKEGQYSKLINNFRLMFRKDFIDHWFMTSTRIEFRPQGMDKVIHDYGISSEFELDTDIIGSSDWINAQSGFENTIEALLGTSDLAEVEGSYEWVSGKKPHLWRPYQKPPKKEEVRALVLGVYGNVWFDINADDVVINWPARGVVRRKIFHEK